MFRCGMFAPHLLNFVRNHSRSRLSKDLLGSKAARLEGDRPFRVNGLRRLASPLSPILSGPWSGRAGVHRIYLPIVWETTRSTAAVARIILSVGPSAEKALPKTACSLATTSLGTRSTILNSSRVWSGSTFSYSAGGRQCRLFHPEYIFGIPEPARSPRPISKNS